MIALMRFGFGGSRKASRKWVLIALILVRVALRLRREPKSLEEMGSDSPDPR
jgi:hypothetical protein